MKEKLNVTVLTLMLISPWTILLLRQMDWALTSPWAELLIYGYAVWMSIAGIFSIRMYRRHPVHFWWAQVCVVVNILYMVAGVLVIILGLVNNMH